MGTTVIFLNIEFALKKGISLASLKTYARMYKNRNLPFEIAKKMLLKIQFRKLSESTR